jgi:thioredoxin-like negative regulator of GroEL
MLLPPPVFISSGKNGMIKFFQPWCGHCTRMKPDWDRLAEEAHPSVFIADINCSLETQLCLEEGIDGFPTIKVYKDGSEDTYSDGRDFNSLKAFIDEQLAQKCVASKAAETCSRKAITYISKWNEQDQDSLKIETIRLERMAAKSMTADLKAWLRERIIILKQLTAKDEL